MRIKKIYQGELPENKILNVQSESSTDTYSCDYINNLGVGGGDALDELPIGSVIRYDGDDIPEGWEEIEDSGGTSDLHTEPLSSMTLNLTEEYSLTSETRYTQVVLPMKLTTSNGNKFTYENNGVRIGAGVSKVIISAQLGTRTQVKDALYGVMATIYRNDTYLTSYRSLWIGTNTQYTTEQVSPTLIDVQEGDLITVAVYIDAVGPSIKIQTASTYLTVMEVSSEIANITKNITQNITHDITTSNLSLIYSTEEQRIGAWFDGKPLYQKTVDFGNLPNATNKSVAHEVANVDNVWIDKTASYFVDTRGHYYDVSDFEWHCNIDRTYVNIETNENRASAKAIVTIRYTKTTD